MNAEQNPGDRLIAKVLRDLVAEQTFDTFAELVHALHRRLARLRIRYQQHEFDDAIALVGTNRRLVRPATDLQVGRPVDTRIESRPVSPVEAEAILANIECRMKESDGRSPHDTDPATRSALRSGDREPDGDTEADRPHDRRRHAITYGPRSFPTGGDADAHEARVRAQARDEVAATYRRDRRRPALLDRLAAIFEED